MDECRPSIWDRLESEFAEDPEALVLNVTLLLGLAARASELSDIHGQDEEILLELPSQSVFTSLLEEIAEAGQSNMVSDQRQQMCLFLFEALQQKLIAKRPDATLYFSPDELRVLFAIELKSAASYKRNVHEYGVKLDDMARMALRRLRKDILELSEDMFIEETNQRADQGMPIDISRFNTEIVHRFCDKAYWQHYCDSISLAEARGDIVEWSRLNRIGRSYLRWIKDQRTYIEYVLGLPQEIGTLDT